MKNKTRIIQLTYTVLRIIIPVLLIWLLISKVDWESIKPLFKQIGWWKIFVSVVVFFVAELIVVLRWRSMLLIKHIDIPFVKLTGYVLMSVFASNFLPSTVGGDVLKIVAVTRDCKKNRGLASASVVADRLFNISGMVVLFPFALITIGTQIGLIGLSNESGQLLSTVGIIPWINQLWEKAVKIWATAKEWFTSPRSVILLFGLSIISIGISFGSFWIILKSLGIPLSFWQASAVCILTYFVSLIPIAINGLGIQEGAITYLLMQLGTGTEQAIAAAFLLRIVTLCVSLSGGIWLLVAGRNLLSLARNQQKVDKELTRE